jgi:hypothetical protein
VEQIVKIDNFPGDGRNDNTFDIIAEISYKWVFMSIHESRYDSGSRTSREEGEMGVLEMRVYKISLEKEFVLNFCSLTRFGSKCQLVVLIHLSSKMQIYRIMEFLLSEQYTSLILYLVSSPLHWIISTPISNI